MKSAMSLFIVVSLILLIMCALVISISSATPFEEQITDHDKLAGEFETSTVEEEEEETMSTLTSLRGASRLLAGSSTQQRATLTCNNYPRVCRAKGSAGPDCCKKKCVNVMTDKLNCGACGHKCRYSEICCKGSCVNRLSNKRHCGGCGNKCDTGSSCVYGLCSYAN